MNRAAQRQNATGNHMPEVRSSNLELFRIVTMLLIVAHHYVVNSGLTADGGPIYADPMSWRSLFLLIFGAFGKTGINCFVLITGYFMCTSKITAKKFCKLLFEIEFYNVVIWILFLLTGYEKFSLAGFFDILLPIRNIKASFVECYLVFYLFIPFLNILLMNISERQYVRLLLLCSVIYVFIDTIPTFSVRLNYVSWFVVLYFIGAYIRLYEKRLFSNACFWGWCALAVFLTSVVSVVGMTWIGTLLSNHSLTYWFLSDSNRLLAVALALAAFLFFKNLKMKNSRFVNTVAASAFGVLMIHANSDTMRKWLWQDVLDNVGMYGSQWLVFHAIGSVTAIFLVCTAIDCLRIQLIEKPFFKLWDEYWYRFEGMYQKMENKLCETLDIRE